jgi:16S rRNA (cytidine1402-2'-O)-methyltransferase
VAATLADLAGSCGDHRPVCVARELTKRFEETWSGGLAEAAALARAGEPRGEHVIVIAGRVGTVPEMTTDSLEAAVSEALARGLSARDAAAEVAALHGVPKRRAYETAVSLRKR